MIYLQRAMGFDVVCSPPPDKGREEEWAGKGVPRKLVVRKRMNDRIKSGPAVLGLLLYHIYYGNSGMGTAVNRCDCYRALS